MWSTCSLPVCYSWWKYICSIHNYNYSLWLLLPDIYIYILKSKNTASISHKNHNYPLLWIEFRPSYKLIKLVVKGCLVGGWSLMTFSSLFIGCKGRLKNEAWQYLYWKLLSLRIHWRTMNKYYKLVCCSSNQIHNNELVILKI